MSRSGPAMAMRLPFRPGSAPAMLSVGGLSSAKKKTGAYTESFDIGPELIQQPLLSHFFGNSPYSKTISQIGIYSVCFRDRNRIQQERNFRGGTQELKFYISVLDF